MAAHRPDADPGRAASAAGHGRVMPGIATDGDPIAAANSAPALARPPPRRHLPEADQTTVRPQWPRQRIRTRCVEVGIKAGGRILEPDFNAAGSYSLTRP